MIISYHATIKDSKIRREVQDHLRENKISHIRTGQTITVEKKGAKLNFVSTVLAIFDHVNDYIEEYGFVMTPEKPHDHL